MRRSREEEEEEGKEEDERAAIRAYSAAASKHVATLGGLFEHPKGGLQAAVTYSSMQRRHAAELRRRANEWSGKMGELARMSQNYAAIGKHVYAAELEEEGRELSAKILAAETELRTDPRDIWQWEHIWRPGGGANMEDEIVRALTIPQMNAFARARGDAESNSSSAPK